MKQRIDAIIIRMLPGDITVQVRRGITKPNYWQNWNIYSNVSAASVRRLHGAQMALLTNTNNEGDE
jgi:hypothetical protein